MITVMPKMQYTRLHQITNFSSSKDIFRKIIMQARDERKYTHHILLMKGLESNDYKNKNPGVGELA